jgi:small subunit ribosomal protein S17
MSDQVEKKKHLFTGKVISNKMDKTITVKTERTFTHPKFFKIVRVSKKYKVHDEENAAKNGDVVEFHEGRPVSKTKYMYLSRIVKKNPAEHKQVEG